MILLTYVAQKLWSTNVQPKRYEIVCLVWNTLVRFRNMYLPTGKHLYQNPAISGSSFSLHESLSSERKLQLEWVAEKSFQLRGKSADLSPTGPQLLYGPVNLFPQHGIWSTGLLTWIPPWDILRIKLTSSLCLYLILIPTKLSCIGRIDFLCNSRGNINFSSRLCTRQTFSQV